MTIGNMAIFPWFKRRHMKVFASIQANEKYRNFNGAVKFLTQIREQMSGPDLHVFTLKFLALKKWFSPPTKHFPNFF